ncbi:hypothetical protein [Melittangium boletus]|uniref:hypothetical protein n=1 Tax=Melittangium boletus TaxID=83453 RepID=UPI003DA3B11B
MDFTKARGLFTSWATPVASWPISKRRSISARSVSARRRRRSLSASCSSASSRSSWACRSDSRSRRYVLPPYSPRPPMPPKMKSEGRPSRTGRSARW